MGGETGGKKYGMVWQRRGTERSSLAEEEGDTEAVGEDDIVVHLGGFGKWWNSTRRRYLWKGRARVRLRPPANTRRIRVEAMERLGEYTANTKVDLASLIN